MHDIRILEDEIKRELDEKMDAMGMKAGSDAKSTDAKSTPY